MNDYQLVIFDWDGTLVDSQAQIIRCLQLAFEQLDLLSPDDQAIRQIVGLSLDEAISRLDATLDDDVIGRLASRYRDIAYADKGHASGLFPGTENCLNKFRQQSLYLAVATGKSRRGLDAALVASGIDRYFDITRCADETRSKPHPLMLEEILTDLNLSAAQAVMVGDTIYDIEMANGIGMDSIAVTYGMHEKAQLLKSSPRYFVDTIAELEQLICAV